MVYRDDTDLSSIWALRDKENYQSLSLGVFLYTYVYKQCNPYLCFDTLSPTLGTFFHERQNLEVTPRHLLISLFNVLEMKIGLQFSQPGLINEAPSEYISKFISWVALAHEKGFQSFWMGQHFILKQYLLLQPLPTLARISAVTRDMHLGTAVLLLPLLNPLDVAEQGAVIDALTRGRFILGVGQGYRQSEALGSGVNKKEISLRFEESIQTIKHLWEREESSYSGTHFSFINAGINPRPIQRPRPQILIGAQSESAIRRAGRIGDGWIVPPGIRDQELEKLAFIFREEARNNGTSGDILLMRAYHVTKHSREAIRIRSLIASHFERKRSWGRKKNCAEDPRTEPDFSIVGDAEHCISRIEYYRKKFNPKHLILLQGFQGTRESELMNSLMETGDKVIPIFRDGSI